MKMTEIISLLDARLLCGAVEDDYEFDSAFASDMMSDVLAYGQGQALLLTGLLNQQVILLLRQPNCHRVRMVDTQAAQRFLRRGDHPRLLKAEFFPLDCAERFDNRRVIRRQ